MIVFGNIVAPGVRAPLSGRKVLLFLKTENWHVLVITEFLVS